MLKTWLKKAGFVLLELAVVAGGLWYVAGKKGISTISEVVPALEQAVREARPKAVFPERQDPIIRKFEWEYKGVKYGLEKTLYGSVDGFYKNQPKEYSYFQVLPVGWENEYYAMFLKSDEADRTVPELAAELQALGKKHRLSDDQTVELALAFVQAIPYDDAKAENILAKTGTETMRFPYEVLYEQQGVCSDKSLLAYALLRQMGYGAALFAFEQDNHMAVAVECPQDHSTYGSGYCYAETTSIGNKIGIIPDFDVQSSRAVGVRQLSDYDPDQDQQAGLKKLGQVTILLPIRGSVYSGIIRTEKIAAEIERLKKSMETSLPELQAQKNTIGKEEKNLENLRKELEKFMDKGDIDKYNALVEKYNALLAAYKKDVKKYNSSVNLYNQYVQKYNALIRE